jgi:hypothetical protein
VLFSGGPRMLHRPVPQQGQAGPRIWVAFIVLAPGQLLNTIRKEMGAADTSDWTEPFNGSPSSSAARAQSEERG